MKTLKKEELSSINGGMSLPKPPRSASVIRLYSSGSYSSGSGIHNDFVESGSYGQP
ncbi:bacteriocin [Aquimarina sp. 2201CG1-2-11]|uniref:bacteriocin n=1 Tax=Aquimarina discodermiae TaxID=3231043 RepID=UPI00346204B1